MEFRILIVRSNLCPFVCNRQYRADRSCIKYLDGVNPIFNTAASITRQMVFTTRFVVLYLYVMRKRASKLFA